MLYRTYLYKDGYTLNFKNNDFVRIDGKYMNFFDTNSIKKTSTIKKITNFDIVISIKIYTDDNYEYLYIESKIANTITCDSCYGMGECECCSCGHEHECQKCYGTGEIDADVPDDKEIYKIKKILILDQEEFQFLN